MHRPQGGGVKEERGGGGGVEGGGGGGVGGGVGVGVVGSKEEVAERRREEARPEVERDCGAKAVGVRGVGVGVFFLWVRGRDV